MSIIALPEQGRKNVAVRALATYPLLKEMSLSSLEKMGLEQLAEMAFPLLSLHREPHYFVGSIAALLLEEDYEDQFPFAVTLPLEWMALDRIGGIALKKEMVEERLRFLTQEGIVPTQNAQIHIVSIDVLLRDFLHAHFGEPLEYNVPQGKIINFPRREQSDTGTESIADFILRLEHYFSVQKYSPEIIERVIEEAVIITSNHFCYDIERKGHIFRRAKTLIHNYSSSPENDEDEQRRVDLTGVLEGRTFSELYLEFNGRLRGYFKKKRSLSESEAEELAHDTLLRAFRFKDNFAPGTNLPAWLYKMGSNLAINYLRRKSRGRELEQDHSDTLHNGFTSPAEILREKSEYLRVYSLIEEAVSGTFRDCFVLRQIHEFEYSEIAFTLNIPIGTVMSRLGRAKKEILECLEKRGITSYSAFEKIE